MPSILDAANLVPSRVEEPENEHEHEPNRLARLQDLIDYAIVPPEDVSNNIIYSIQGAAARMKEHAKRKKHVQREVVKHIAMHMVARSGEEAEEEAEGSSEFLKKIFGDTMIEGVEALASFTFRTLLGGLFDFLAWVAEDVVLGALRMFVSFIVEPAMMALLGILTTPVGWAILGLLGAGAVAAYVFDKMVGHGGADLDFKTFLGDTGHVAATAFRDVTQAVLNPGPQGPVDAAGNRIPVRDVTQRDRSGITGAAYPRAAGAAEVSSSTGAARGLGGLISRGEGTYESVNLGAAHGYKADTRDLASMTVAEVMKAQQDGEFNAAGRYQIIKPTLADAYKKMHLTGSEKFDAAMQDRIFEEYLAGIKRPQIANYISGKSNDINAAVLAASQEWASVAAPSGARTKNGTISDGTISYYTGVANNKASISAAAMTQSLKAERKRSTGRDPDTEESQAIAAQQAAGKTISLPSTKVSDKPIPATAPPNLVTQAASGQASVGPLGPSPAPPDRTIVRGPGKTLIAVS